MAKTTRADDERVLRMIRLRAVDGMEYPDIAARFGMSKSSVIGAVDRVRSADIQKSGEPERVVRAAYERGGWSVDRAEALFV